MQWRILARRQRRCICFVWHFEPDILKLNILEFISNLHHSCKYRMIGSRYFITISANLRLQIVEVTANYALTRKLRYGQHLRNLLWMFFPLWKACFTSIELP